MVSGASSGLERAIFAKNEMKLRFQSLNLCSQRSRDYQMSKNLNLIPITILTGFLGSGKTTLLNQLLKNPNMQDTAVIINEYGEVGVDHFFVEKIANEIIEISSGCICCTVRGDLVATLENLGTESKSKSAHKFKRIVIETTGIADPTLVVRAIMQNPILASQFQIEKIIACVDSSNGAEVLASNSEALKQIAFADQIALTKTDLLEISLKQGLADNSLIEHLKKLNPLAEILDCSSQDFEVECLVEQQNNKTEKNLNQKASNKKNLDLVNSTENQHLSSIQTFTLKSEKFISTHELEHFIDVLGSTVGSDILRVKGMIGVIEKPDQPAIVQGVKNFFHSIEFLENWPSEDRISFLVIISINPIEELVSKLFNAFFGIPDVDSPDRIAIIDNPLTIAGFA